MGQRLRVDARVDEHADVAEHDPLGAGELSQRLLVHLAAGLERLQLAQHLEQPPVGLLAAAADRVEQLGERGVGVERERLRGSDLGHPRLHVASGDAHQVRAVVDAQAVGVDLVHQIAGLAGVEPLADHRPVADRESDEHVEVLGALAARGGGQQPAVGDRSEPELGERLVRLGRGVGVAERLVGDQQMPRDRLQVGRVAVEHAVGRQHHPRAVGELAVEAADLPGDLPLVGDDEQLEVRRQRRQPAARRAAGRAPRATGRAAGPRRRPARETAAASTARCASARPELIVFPVPTADASTPEPTTFSAAISRWRPSSTGSSASGRASVIRTTWRAPGRQRHVRTGSLERAQLAERLLGHHTPRASPTRRRRS